MIVEQRTYTLHPGRGPDYLAIYGEETYAASQRILGNMIGVFTTEIGELNQFITMVAYDSWEERAERRRQLRADPAYLRYSPQVRPMIVRQESKILIPAPFAPLK
ncbi:NIPSNAP family protein [Xanthobacter dioxanivorans]|uniref:NIPSNAP family protein n=1 Tax=Xanthobacter dioxanivorans TaxID=2528964 RepID=A0A974PT04_9HYPH|nr:NIPSNAP family protein [Xanthobacter dioxanivorans]QRG09252.1 NIPSNAP family protein [Xanthobacter dioxanivorans]